MRLSHCGELLRSVTLLFPNGAGGSDPALAWHSLKVKLLHHTFSICCRHIGKTLLEFSTDSHPLQSTSEMLGSVRSCACTHITAAHPLSQDSHHCPKEEQNHLQLWRDESSESSDTPSPLILLVLDSQSVQQGPCHPSERKRITTVIRCKPNRSLHGCEIPLIPSLRIPEEMHY